MGLGASRSGDRPPGRTATEVVREPLAERRHAADAGPEARVSEHRGDLSGGRLRLGGRLDGRQATNHRADSEELREQSIGELLKRLADETATLVRKELELAKVEYAEKGKRAGLGAGLLSGAMVAALLALGAFTAFLVLALDGALPNWAAALIVAALYGIVATVLALRGRERLEEAGGPVPEQTKETIEEDLQWARNRATSAKR